MTSLAEAEIKYGYVVQSAGGKIFGIERPPSVGKEEEKLRMGLCKWLFFLEFNQTSMRFCMRERPDSIAFTTARGCNVPALRIRAS
jgi:hypothetical protein